MALIPGVKNASSGQIFGSEWPALLSRIKLFTDINATSADVSRECWRACSGVCACAMIIMLMHLIPAWKMAANTTAVMSKINNQSHVVSSERVCIWLEYAMGGISVTWYWGWIFFLNHFTIRKSVSVAMEIYSANRAVIIAVILFHRNSSAVFEHEHTLPLFMLILHLIPPHISLCL